MERQLQALEVLSGRPVDALTINPKGLTEGGSLRCVRQV